MLVTSHFAFLHVPKTAGEFLREVIIRHFPVVIEGGKHDGWFALPVEHRSLPRFTLIRNPWDWHVSFWAYMHQYAAQWGTEPLWEELCRGSFADFMQSPPPPGYERGIYMSHVLRMIESVERPSCEVGQTEKLAEHFLSFLARYEIPVSDGLRADIQGPPRNVSTRTRYQDYYDPELRELVASSCAPVIERFGYEFEQPGPVASRSNGLLTGRPNADEREAALVRAGSQMAHLIERVEQGIEHLGLNYEAAAAARRRWRLALEELGLDDAQGEERARGSARHLARQT